MIFFQWEPTCSAPERARFFFAPNTPRISHALKLKISSAADGTLPLYGLVICFGVSSRSSLLQSISIFVFLFVETCLFSFPYLCHKILHARTRISMGHFGKLSFALGATRLRMLERRGGVFNKLLSGLCFLSPQNFQQVVMRSTS